MSAAATHRHTVRRTVRTLAAVAAGLGIAGSTAGAAEAISIKQPETLHCHSGQSRLSVDPVRVWADRGVPETVVWRQAVERYNGRQWRPYVTYSNYATFDYFGRSATSWSSDTRTSGGGRYHNNRMSLPIRHTGWYRVISAVATAHGASSAVYVAGGNSCRITY